jgi:Tfp pilus assembly protein PilO
MDRQKALIIRVLIAFGLVYAGWAFIVRPMHEKLELQELQRKTQQDLISQAGHDFETRRLATDEAYHAVHVASDHIFDGFDVENPLSARQLIGTSAHESGVEINRIEPLRIVELTNVTKKNRYASKSDSGPENAVKFLGEGIRVEVDGSFAGIAGFLHHLNRNSKTVQLENFRMISSGGGSSRMMAQFTKYELVDSPIEHTNQVVAGASTEDK